MSHRARAPAPGARRAGRAGSRARIPQGAGWVLVPLLAPLLVFIEGVSFRRLLAPGEAFTYNYPVHLLVGRIWSDGELPAWNVWSFSGSPLLATGQAGVFYPLNFLFVVLPPVVANNAVVVIGFALAGLGGYLLGRHLTGDPVAGAVTGIAFAFSGFFFAHLAHQSVLASATWLPWMFYGFERLRERITPRRAAVGGGAVMLAFLGGHFQMAAIALMALGLYAGLVLVADAGPGRPERRTTALGLILMVVVGLGLSAPQWLSTINVLDATDRAVLSFEAATSYSLTPSHLPLLAFPYLFGGGPANAPFLSPYAGDWNLTELSGYPGVVAFVLAAVGMAGGRRDRRVWVLAGLGVVAVMAAMGSSTFLGRLIYALPVYGQLRSWARFVVVLDLVVAVLAGYGVAACRRASVASATAPAAADDRHQPSTAEVERVPAPTGGTSSGAGTEDPTASLKAPAEGGSVLVAERAPAPPAVAGESALGVEAVPAPPAGDPPAANRPAATGRPDWRRLVQAAAAAGGVVVALAAVVGLIGPVTEHFPAGGPHLLARAIPLAGALAGVAVVVVLVRAGPRRRRVLSGVAGALVLVEVVGAFGWHMLWRSELVATPEQAEVVAEPGLALDWGDTSDAAGGIDRFLIAGSDLGATQGYPQINAAVEARTVNGFDPLAPVDYLKAAGYAQYFGGVEAPAEFWAPGSDLLDLLRVTTVLTGTEPGQARPGPGDKLSGGEPVAAIERLRFDYQPTLPDAFLVGATRPLDQQQTMQAIAGNLPLEPAGEALVNAGPCRDCPGPGAPGPAGTARRRSGTNTVDVDVDADRPALLVVSESWFPGWEATVDGRPAEVVRADGLLLGVPVPEGTHQVRLHYRPPGLRTGLVLAAVTALALAGWWGLSRRATGSPRRARP